MIGLAAGIALGLYLDRVLPQSELLRGRGTDRVLAIALGTIGLFLGWQAMLGIAGLALGSLLAAATVARLVSLHSSPLTMPSLCAAALLHLCFWRTLCGLPWWPGTTADWPSVAVGSSVVLALGGALGVVAPGRSTGRWLPRRSKTQRKMPAVGSLIQPLAATRVHKPNSDLGSGC